MIRAPLVLDLFARPFDLKRIRAATISWVIPSSEGSVPFSSRFRNECVPGFGPRFLVESAAPSPLTEWVRGYRDYDHSFGTHAGGSGTGISATRVPGMEPHLYRDVGHGGTGNGTTGKMLDTGISATQTRAKCQTALGKYPGNSVSLNRSKNTTTGVTRIISSLMGKDRRGEV